MWFPRPDARKSTVGFRCFGGVLVARCLPLVSTQGQKGWFGWFCTARSSFSKSKPRLQEDPLLVVYASKTGNVARFVQRLGVEALRIQSGTELIKRPALLITYTTGFGQAPVEVLRFVEANRPYLLGVAVSGNRNWGAHFARAGEVLFERYGLPVVHKFELSGNEKDIQTVREVIHALFGTQQRGAA